MRIAFTGNILPFGEGIAYGGERLLYYLIEELSNMGHDIYLFSCKGTNIPKKYIKDFIEVPPLHHENDVIYDAITRYSAEKHINFDVYACNYFGSGWNPKVIDEFPYVEFTWCRWCHIGWQVGFDKAFNTISYSKCLQMDFDQVGVPTVMINHGVPKNLYSFVPKAKDYVVFIGKLEGGKAPHLAIKIAKAAGKKIVILAPPYNTNTFWQEVYPYIDNKNVFWVRGVDDKMKQEIMGSAFCFISSNENKWKEHFGLVNIESLAMGVPILAFNKIGNESAIATDDLIIDGKHGYFLNYFNSNNEQYMIAQGVDLLNRMDDISREECRSYFENNFTSWHMAKRHEWLYKEANKGNKHGRLEFVDIGEDC